eukprot:TRINITY_DN2541_c0_g1_i1.p1 TRINITY_DN2541_c0_g1~~TRINITY_DN2541_c0_g1_i1.p1  ORF type:complete len:740 (-),score=206.06 TRINITY_DN2541_c0_g1_i1:189-2408(-)
MEGEAPAKRKGRTPPPAKRARQGKEPPAEDDAAPADAEIAAAEKRKKEPASVEPAAEDEEDTELDEDEEEDDEDLSDSVDDVGGVEAGADESSDDSEDDAPRNRIGNVPLEWYKDEDHVGYDLGGEKIMRTLKEGEIDALLESKDNPDAWRTIKDHKNQREIVLTDTDLEVIRRIRQRMFPSAQTDTMEMVEFENRDAAIHTETRAHPPKSRFQPSKWERMKVKKLVALLREGKIRPPKPPAPKVWDLWGEDGPARRKGPPPLPAPKPALPGHAESYNPPSEYLLSEEEQKAWESEDEQDRQLSHLPQKFDALRRVPAYKEFITERFKRCLDLYLVPRALKQRMNVDPDSLLPKLPNPKDLRPFPTHIAVSYDGHTGMVRSVAVDGTGQWLATTSGDKTLRIWEVSTGRCFHTIQFEDTATAVAWNPVHHILAVAAQEHIYFVDPGLEPPPVRPKDAAEAADEEEKTPVQQMLSYRETAATKAAQEGEVEAPEGAKARAVKWEAVAEDSPLYKSGCRLMIKTDGDVQSLVWHHKGNYCAAVSPKAHAPSNQCIIHAINSQKSMRPFSKLKGGECQAAAFHPLKPHFLVATKKSVRIYDLQKQEPLKQLISGAKWIGSITVHPTGDHVVVGSYDRRMVWFDLDFATKPYKTLQYHDRAVRRACFHQGKYPLLAACSDDGTVSVLHAKVFSDLMQSPQIVPVKRLRDHIVNQGLGVLDCQWHPHQPWLFTAGADGKVYLWA